MDEQAKINERIKDLEETINLLSNHEYTERWVVTEFLSNLNIQFTGNELEKSKEEPSDIIFRGASFQIKALHDEDRKMIKEYKDDLEKTKLAKTYAEAMNFREYTPTDISINEIVNQIEMKLNKYILSPEQYSKINMLFYFNRLFHGIKNKLNFTFSNDVLWKKWRSVSVVKNGGVNFIFWAQETAPDYIKSNTGKIIIKNKYL